MAAGEVTDIERNDLDPHHRDKSAWITDLSFRPEHWTRQPALTSKDGTQQMLYREGDEYDPALWDLVPNAWDHDHCAICWTHIWDDDDGGYGFSKAYVNDSGAWVCPPCYELLFRDRVESWIQAGRPRPPAAEGEIEMHEA